MTQLTFPQVRAAVAAYLTASIGLRATANRFGAVNPPMAVVAPQTGCLIRYSVDFDGQTDYNLRAIILVSEGDSASGQDSLDAYLSPVGSQSVHAAVQADPTLGGQVNYCAVIEATGYGLMNWNGVDFLAAQPGAEHRHMTRHHFGDVHHGWWWFWSTCTCGWRSKRRWKPVRAEADQMIHARQASRQGSR